MPIQAGPYGENLAMGYPSAAASVDAWGDERSEYNYDDPSFSEATGHFTQLVWKDSTQVGCARTLCGSHGWYLVCEYWPRGNVIGQFADEVARQTNGTTAAGSGGAATPPPSALVALVLALWWWWWCESGAELDTKSTWFSRSVAFRLDSELDKTPRLTTGTGMNGSAAEGPGHGENLI